MAMTARVRVAAASFALFATLPSTLLACPSCFGAADGPMADGLNAGIAVLLGVTTLVLAAFAAGIARLVRRARLVERMQEHA
jgi:hypothetical protein